MFMSAQSERGKVVTKAGNEYIHVYINDDNGEMLADIKLHIKKDSLGDIIYADIDFAPRIYVNKKLWIDSEVKETWCDECMSRKCQQK